MTTPAMTAQEALATLRADNWTSRTENLAIATVLETAIFDAERRATEAVRGQFQMQNAAIDLSARLSAVEARCGLMRAFVEWAIMDVAFKGGGIDGADIQDKAAELGLLISEKYDPIIHGENDVGAEPGDEWFVYSSILAYPGGKSEVPTDHVVDANKVIVPLSRSGDSALVEAPGNYQAQAVLDERLTVVDVSEAMNLAADLDDCRASLNREAGARVLADDALAEAVALLSEIYTPVDEHGDLTLEAQGTNKSWNDRRKAFIQQHGERK